MSNQRFKIIGILYKDTLNNTVHEVSLETLEKRNAKNWLFLFINGISEAIMTLAINDEHEKRVLDLQRR